MKMTFQAKVVADVTADPINGEPTYQALSDLVDSGNFSLEIVMGGWSRDNEPTIIITAKEDL